MARIAAIFPNEGSHYVGMAKEFYDRSMSTRKFFYDSEKSLSPTISKLCYLSPDTHNLWGPTEIMTALQTKLQGVKNVKTHTQLPRGPIFTPLAADLEGECDKLLNECLGEEKLKNPKIAYHSCADGEYCGS